MIKIPDKNKLRQKRQRRVRKKISGNETCPRLNVFRSNKGIYAQIINDIKGSTLVSASTLEKEAITRSGTKTEKAKIVGTLLAERAIKKNIKKVVFDRGGYLYHGRIEALAKAARKSGLSF